jgi:hypothetical protein
LSGLRAAVVAADSVVAAEAAAEEADGDKW